MGKEIKTQNEIKIEINNNRKKEGMKEISKERRKERNLQKRKKGRKTKIGEKESHK